MERIPALLVILLCGVVLLVMGTLHRGAFQSVIRRFAPRWESENDTVLMASMVMLFWFTLGLVVMYLLLNL